jgi:hypothetical protein
VFGGTEKLLLQESSLFSNIKNPPCRLRTHQQGGNGYNEISRLTEYQLKKIEQ